MCVEVDVAATVGVAEPVDAYLFGQLHVADEAHHHPVEGNIILGHGQPVEVLQAFRKLVSVALPGQQADGLLVVDPVTATHSQPPLQRLLQSLLERQAVRVYSVPVLLCQDEVEGDEASELAREPDPLGEAEERQQCLVGATLFGEAFEQGGLEGLLKEAAHCVDRGVLRL